MWSHIGWSVFAHTKVRSAFINMSPLGIRCCIRLLIKGRVYTTAVRSVLLWSSNPWPFRLENIRRISVFALHCLRSIGRVRWQNLLSNAEVRQKVHLGGTLDANSLKCLGRISCPQTAYPSVRCCNGWTAGQGGQSMARKTGIEKATTRIGSYISS